MRRAAEGLEEEWEKEGRRKGEGREKEGRRMGEGWEKDGSSKSDFQRVGWNKNDC